MINLVAVAFKDLGVKLILLEKLEPKKFIAIRYKNSAAEIKIEEAFLAILLIIFDELMLEKLKILEDF